ncbi:MAG: class beta-lactamase [Spirosoma sp.]|nr:class beta-lactamase [Spirosoma sp.]
MQNQIRPVTKRCLFSIFLFISCILIAQSSKGQSTSRRSLTDLQKQLAQLAQPAQGRVGVAATILETGESVSLHGDEQFPMQSVYKFPIGMAVLHQVDQGKLTLNQKIHITKLDYVSHRQHSPIRDNHPDGTEMSLSEVLRYAVSESDGSASDVLLRLLGGGAVVSQYLQRLGVSGIKVIDTEKEIGRDNAIQYRNWAQPTQMVTLLKALQEGRDLSKTSQTLLMRLMKETPTGLRRLKGQLPTQTVVMHKTGTSWTIDGVTAATNDVGLIRLPHGEHLAVAVFVSDSKADEATRESVIANITKAIWDYWH